MRGNLANLEGHFGDGLRLLCGARLIVEREGGSISLHLAEGLAAVRGGVDKTAAELALVRLDKEMMDLLHQWETLKSRHTQRANETAQIYLIGIGFSIVIGLIMLGSSQILWLLVVVPVIIIMLYLWSNSANRVGERNRKEIQPIREEYERVTDRIAAAKAVVDA